MIRKPGIALAAIALILFLFPSVTGFFRHVRTTANEKLNDEFVIDNYKQLYIDLHDKQAKCQESLRKFEVEREVLVRKREYAEKQAEAVKRKLIETGTSDPVAFMKTKKEYDLLLSQIDNFNNMAQAYSNAVAKLSQTLDLIKSNMAKSRMNIASLESKKECVDTLKSVNSIVEDINGMGDSDLATSIERLKDDELRESIKLETLSDLNGAEEKAPMTRADIEAYIQSLD